ncbi:DUF4245 domain-containing protein [Actinokineospora sp. 24-640]
MPETPIPDPDAQSRPDPTARRLAQSLRDMVWSLVALLIVVGVVAAFSRGCSFSPGSPTVDPSTAPTVELADTLPGTAKTVDFPLRLPAVPPSWRANSASTDGLPPTSVVVRAGWLTPQRFVQLSQSGAPAADLLRAETELTDPAPAGEVVLGSAKWTVYPGRRDEVAWLADLGDVRLLITGTGAEAEFRALAEAAQAAPPLPTE